jgi:hypothetical protein
MRETRENVASLIDRLTRANVGHFAGNTDRRERQMQGSDGVQLGLERRQGALGDLGVASVGRYATEVPILVEAAD